MAKVSIAAVFHSDLETVWNVVTSLTETKWRSDLSRVEVLNEKQFVEYTKDGYATIFTITMRELMKLWEFDMENTNMKGHWTGIFSGKNHETEIEFTEEVNAKKMIMKPFVKGYLMKQQKQYIEDLQKALSEIS